MWKAKVVEVGDQLAIEFPPEFVEAAGFREGTVVHVFTDGQTLMLSTSATPLKGWWPVPDESGNATTA